MAYNFRRGDPGQPFLLPPDLRDWLPEGQSRLVHPRRDRPARPGAVPARVSNRRARPSHHRGFLLRGKVERNINMFWSLAQARMVISDWKADYNHRRRHSALGYQAPAVYAAARTHP
jgi:transposase InsO family protein